MTYKFNKVGSDFTIQIDSGQIVTHSGTSQAAANILGSKISVLTFYPYFEALIDKAVNTIQINGVDVTANTVAAIVASLNNDVFAGTTSGGIGNASSLDTVPDGTTRVAMTIAQRDYLNALMGVNTTE